jgi:hypothetical protein
MPGYNETQRLVRRAYDIQAVKHAINLASSMQCISPLDRFAVRKLYFRHDVDPIIVSRTARGRQLQQRVCRDDDLDSSAAQVSIAFVADLFDLQSKKVPYKPPAVKIKSDTNILKIWATLEIVRGVTSVPLNASEM